MKTNKYNQIDNIFEYLNSRFEILVHHLNNKIIKIISELIITSAPVSRPLAATPAAKKGPIILVIAPISMKSMRPPFLSPKHIICSSLALSPALTFVTIVGTASEGREIVRFTKAVHGLLKNLLHFLKEKRAT